MRATITRIHTTDLHVVGPTIHGASVALEDLLFDAGVRLL